MLFQIPSGMVWLALGGGSPRAFFFHKKTARTSAGRRYTHREPLPDKRLPSRHRGRCGHTLHYGIDDVKTL